MTDTENTPKHPLQPLVWDSNRVIRFKGNAIVRHLLDHGGIDLNQIACMDFPQEDREQFAMLIGYSVSGAGDLSYMSGETIAASDAMAEALRQGKSLDHKDARIFALEQRLASIRDTLEKMKEGVADLYNIHPDDLQP